MAKSKPKKAAKSSAPKGKAKPASKSTMKSTAKVVKKSVNPAKKEKKKVIANKNVKAGKAVKAPAKKAPAANAGAKNIKALPKKAVAPVKEKAPAKPAAKTAVASAKPVTPPAKGPAPAPGVKVPRAPKVKERPVLTPEQMALPKLPSNIHYKKTKQKLAPGEKRLLKTEVITHHVIVEKPIDPEKKTKVEPKGKYQMEFIIRCPVTLLYDFLTTPSGLQEWFADDVNLKDDEYTFNWDGQLQKAQLLNAKIDNYLRFRWVDKPDGTYVEFRITQDELTGEVSLTVTDFGENEEDIVTNKRLWESQIQRLIKVMGAY
jgi:uncharacterized protein YndB with AHSA1/START domain